MMFLLDRSQLRILCRMSLIVTPMTLIVSLIHIPSRECGSDGFFASLRRRRMPVPCISLSFLVYL
ncbi:hypothetical protein B5M44_23800 [Shinella sumterensis]|nr:hypothetical protein B5M44_23800 [Shinella sumterensis]